MDINVYRYSNISISNWWYKEAEAKYIGVGSTRRFLRYGPVYSSAITDTVFLDIDCLDKEGNILQERVDAFHKLWKWAIEHDYKRTKDYYFKE